MAEPNAKHWYLTAAYLYVLHLDDLALAWEYLRRHPDYQRDWLRGRRQRDTTHCWGLRLLEDPALDAHPAWFSDHDAVVQLYPDADPPPDATAFAFWRVPGRKHLIHDGKRLVLVLQWPGHCVRLALAPGLEDGMVIVPIGYTTPALFDISQVGGGTPYGASTIAGGDGSRQPDDRELDIARHQGEYVANITAKLKG